MAFDNGTISDAINGIIDKAKEGIIATKDATVSAVDVNGDGQIDIEDIIVLGFQ